MDTFLHSLYTRFYVTRRKCKAREICIRCGKVRVLGVRGKAKGLCKPCRKMERQSN